ncbi:type VI secretion system baseplate subunit TssF [Rhodoferax sp.]|uniref:type VI secretion system baseplate subunit TssF n=1 Tax=Rhodoferax sp. TaxID=50421 RepID=UPI0027528318|nr:type VI secretion system baseplate subunit TssF [Rhodoferax sp.]
MQAYGNQLKDYYQRELVTLREDTQAFAQTHPVEAGALGLGGSGARDPQVEMLMQAFAFLTGRVLYEMEASKAVLANAMLADLYPHLAAPLPCMAVAQVQVKPDGANGAVLERARQVHASVLDDQGNQVVCKLRTSIALPLTPLAVTHVALLQPDAFPVHIHDEATLSVLRVRVTRLGAEPIKSLKHRALRFYIDPTQKNAYFLHELLAVNLVGVSLASTDDSALGRMQGHDLHWLGFAEDEAALPGRTNMHPGHRLLQEYFACPEKFMFFETGALDLDGLDTGFDLFFHFNAPVAPERQTTPQALKLNCVPLVNLYLQRIDPLTLDHARYEYWLRADVQGHRHCEVYALQTLNSIKSDGTLRDLRPYFEMESAASLQSQDYFYVLRREENQLGQVAGTEVYISFLDTRHQPTAPPPEVIGGRALCTNRRLPERMVAGQALMLEGPGPVTGLALVGRPSPHDTPALMGRRPWALVSQLSLNHLSLADGPQALAALKGMLRCHVGPAQVVGVKQIDGIRNVQCRPVLRPLVRDGIRSMVQALHVQLTLDRTQFESGGVVLFAMVLRHFMAMYASVNTVVEVSLATMDCKQTVKQWAPLAGAQIVL